MSIEYLCMLDMRGAMGSGPGGGRWPQKSGKARMLNSGIDLVLAAAAQYSLGSWCGIQALCLSSNLSIIVWWWDSSAPFSSSSCSSPFWPSGASSLGEEYNHMFRQLGSETKGIEREVKLFDWFKDCIVVIVFRMFCRSQQLCYSLNKSDLQVLSSSSLLSYVTLETNHKRRGSQTPSIRKQRLRLGKTVCNCCWITKQGRV